MVGAPWRCGVLTTEGGIAGIGLGYLLGSEHGSTPQSGVEATRLLKRSFSRLYCCCCCFRVSRRCNVYVHTTLRMQRQSLRLIELITCVMSSYTQPEGSHKPPPAPARPPRLRASNEWTTVSMTSTTRTSTTVKKLHLGQLCTCGIDGTTGTSATPRMN